MIMKKYNSWIPAFAGMMTLMAVGLVMSAPAFAANVLFQSYSGRASATVTSDTVTANPNGTLAGGVAGISGKYKTAICFGTLSSVGDTVKLQETMDGTNWFDAVDDSYNKITWTKATLGTIKKWWDNGWEYRAAIIKGANRASTDSISLQLTGGK